MNHYVVMFCQGAETVERDVIAASTVDAIISVLKSLPLSNGAFAISGRVA